MANSPLTQKQINQLEQVLLNAEGTVDKGKFIANYLVVNIE